MAYGPTSPLGGIRIFYSSSILWDSDLSSIRVKHFANSDIRLSYPLPPGEPRHYRWSPASREDFEDTLQCYPRSLWLPPLQFPTTNMSLCIANTLAIYTFILVALVITRCLEILSVVLSVPCATALELFAAWIPRQIMPHTYRGFIHPSCSGVLQNSSKCYSIFRESSATYCFGKSYVPALRLLPYV